MGYSLTIFLSFCILGNEQKIGYFRKNMQTAGFEHRSSRIGRNCTANCATTTPP